MPLICTTVFCCYFERKSLELLCGSDFLSVDSPGLGFPLPTSACALATWVLLKGQPMQWKDPGPWKQTYSGLHSTPPILQTLSKLVNLFSLLTRLGNISLWNRGKDELNGNTESLWYMTALKDFNSLLKPSQQTNRKDPTVKEDGNSHFWYLIHSFK